MTRNGILNGLKTLVQNAGFTTIRSTIEPDKHWSEIQSQYWPADGTALAVIYGGDEEMTGVEKGGATTNRKLTASAYVIVRDNDATNRDTLLSNNIDSVVQAVHDNPQLSGNVAHVARAKEVKIVKGDIILPPYAAGSVNLEIIFN